MLIVALTGGSVGGYGTACYLEKIHNELQCSWDAYIDMVTGVSAGSLVAACIAYNHMSPAEMKQVFKAGMRNIFKTNWFTKRWNAIRGLLWGTIYSSKTLQKEVDKIFGNRLVGDDTFVKFMTYATEGRPNLRPRHWKSWKDDTSQADKLADVLVGSCSIPMFFQPKQVRDAWVVDGGLVTNAPTMQAYAEALKLGVPPEKIFILTIQCLGSMRSIAGMARKRSALSWLKPIIPAMISADEASVDYEARTIIGARYMRINLGLNLELDDISEAACADMEKNVATTWEWSKPAVIDFIKRAKAAKT